MVGVKGKKEFFFLFLFYESTKQAIGMELLAGDD